VEARAALAQVDLMGVVSALKVAGRIDGERIGDREGPAIEGEAEVYAQLRRAFRSSPQPATHVEDDKEDTGGGLKGMEEITPPLDRFFVWASGMGFRKSAPPKPSFCVLVVPPNMPPWACLELRSPRGIVPVVLAVTSSSGTDLEFVSLDPCPPGEMDVREHER
jgi:hypothetical protein